MSSGLPLIADIARCSGRAAISHQRQSDNFGIAEILLDGEGKSAVLRLGPATSRGAFRDRHGRGRRDAVDAGSAEDEGAACGRQRRVVLTPRRWCQVGGGNSADDGVNKARSPAIRFTHLGAAEWYRI